ncbi:hypothetical protein [Thalassiella azotivora]
MRALVAATVLVVAALVPAQAAAAQPVNDLQCGFCWDTGIGPRVVPG